MENIDYVIYINLNKRTDRKVEIESELKRLNIDKNKIIRLEAIEHSYPNTGCNLSHSMALKMAFEKKMKNVLILEDDFNFIDDVNKVHSSISQMFLTLNNNWDVIQLTHQTNKAEPYNNLLNITLDSSNAAGYLVNSHMFEPLSRIFFYSAQSLSLTKAHWIFQNDRQWVLFMFTKRWFHFIEPLGYQRDSFSDLSQGYFTSNKTIEIES